GRGGCGGGGGVGCAGADRPAVPPPDAGGAVRGGGRPPRLLLPAEARPKSADRASAAPDRLAPARPPSRADRREPAELDAAAADLFEALRRYRLTVARAEGVAPFIIASDRTLRDIAALRPRTSAELERAHGVGPYKVAKYGAGILQVVAKQAGGQLHSG